MRWVAIVCVWLVSLVAGPALASQDIRYGAAPAWVENAPIPQPQAGAGGAAESLLVDRQINFTDQGEEQYSKQAFKILSSQGMQALGTLAVVWDPANSDLTINTAEIQRDGQVINLLSGGQDFRTLQREVGLAVATLDGTLTAIKEVRDLRIGDVVVFAYTVKATRTLPNFLPEDGLLIAPGPGPGRVRYRAVWPKSIDVKWRAGEGIQGARTLDKGATMELVYDATRPRIPEPPAGAPDKYQQQGLLEISAFRSWEEVSQLFAPLYASAAALSANSPVKAEAARIRQAHATDEARALAALQLVQQQVRYLALMFGQGGYVPATAEATWSQRFGDCKAKSALLVALLNELGIKSEVAAVATTGFSALPDRLPMLGAFNHVIVRAEIGGKVYWLDGTRLGDRDMAELTQARFGWALPFRASGSRLEALDLRPAPRPLVDKIIRLDASAGVDVEGPARFEVVLRGDEGRTIEQLIASVPSSEVEDALKEGWAPEWLKVDKTTFGFDPQRQGFAITFDGKGKFDWPTNPNILLRQLALESAYEDEYAERKPDQASRDAPYSVPFPFYSRVETRVKLPDGGQGFRMMGDDVDTTIAGTEIRRKSSIQNGEAVVEFSLRTMQREVSAEEARTAPARVAALPTKEDAYINAPRNLAPPPSTLNAQSTSEDYVRRAMALMQADDLPGAIAVLNEAVARDPGSADAALARIQLLSFGRDREGALQAATQFTRDHPTDMRGHLVLITNLMMGQRYAELVTAAERVIALDEKESAGHLYRAYGLLHLGRPAEMLASASTAYRLEKEAGRRGQLESLALKGGQLPAAQKTQLTQVLANNPDNAVARYIYGKMLESQDPRRSNEQYDAVLRLQPDFVQALEGRAGNYVALKDDNRALADLDRLLRTNRNATALYMLRAEVYVRLSRPEEALLDYDDVLRTNPNYVEALRSRCELRGQLGTELQKAHDDCSKALQIDPDDTDTMLVRGMVRLRMNSNEEARKDFAEAVATWESAEAHFGLGLSEKRLGQATQGDRDMAKARSMSSSVASKFEKFGIKP